MLVLDVCCLFVCVCITFSLGLCFKPFKCADERRIRFDSCRSVKMCWSSNLSACFSHSNSSIECHLNPPALRFYAALLQKDSSRAPCACCRSNFIPVTLWRLGQTRQGCRSVGSLGPSRCMDSAVACHFGDNWFSWWPLSVNYWLLFDCQKCCSVRGTSQYWSVEQFSKYFMITPMCWLF